MGMTEQEWQAGIKGEPIRTSDGNRARHLIADHLRDLARDRRKEGQTTRAGQLIWLAGKIENGETGSKRIYTLLRKEIALVKQRLTNGEDN